MNRSLYYLVFLGLYLGKSICVAQDKIDQTNHDSIQPDTSAGLGSNKNRIQYNISIQAIGTTGGLVPFWMRSNQYGSIPLSGASSSFMAGTKKEYYMNSSVFPGQPKLMDWGMGFEGRINTNLSENKFILTEGYLKGHLGPLELKAGRSKETMGFTGDTILSSGSFALSGNALGIPKIEMSFPRFYALPVFGGLFAIKGNFSNGWVGKTDIRYSRGAALQTRTFLHEKSFYGRIGKPDWRLKLYGGFNHQAFWGNERKIFGNPFSLSKIESFFYVFTGKAFGDSKVGNHLGSIDLGAEYDFGKLQLTIYRQNIYDVGGLYYLANISDGLNGITIKNKVKNSRKFKWEAVLFEILATKNQGGQSWSRKTPSGDEDYYNSYIYKAGWTYKNIGLGTPLITQRNFARTGQVAAPADYFINNRILAAHLGFNLQYNKWKYSSKVSYSHNFGTYATSTYARTINYGELEHSPGQFGYFKDVKQFSCYIEGNRFIEKNYSIGYGISADKGKLLDNSTGLILKLSKHF